MVVRKSFAVSLSGSICPIHLSQLSISNKTSFSLLIATLVVDTFIVGYPGMAGTVAVAIKSCGGY